MVSARISNVGYLPTYVTHAGKKLDHNEGLWAEVEAHGVEILAPIGGRMELGHLEGWGHGFHSGEASVHFVRGSGSSNAKKLSWTVRGEGTLKLRIGSRRVGWIEKTIEL